MTGMVIAVLAAAFVAVLALLTVAVKAYDDLAAENRRLRQALAARTHPSLRLIAGDEHGIATPTDGGVA